MEVMFKKPLHGIVTRIWTHKVSLKLVNSLNLDLDITYREGTLAVIKVLPSVTQVPLSKLYWK